MRKLIFPAVLAASLLFGASAAVAQDGVGPNRLDEDIFSLSFGVPSGGNAYAPGAFGLWYNMSGLNLGVNLGFGVQSTDIGNDESGAINTRR